MRHLYCTPFMSRLRHICARPNLSALENEQTGSMHRRTIKSSQPPVPKARSATERHETDGVLMELSLQTKREQLFESFRALVNEECLRAGQKRLCVHCGAEMQYVDVIFWLHETDLGCSVRLPFCPCKAKSTSPVRTLKRGAA